MENSKFLGFNVSNNTLACVNYVLLFFGLFSFFPAIIAILLAYSYKNNSDYLNKSHFEFQIETFWSFVLLFIVGSLFVFMWIGWIVIWFAYLFAFLRLCSGFRKAFNETTIVW